MIKKYLNHKSVVKYTCHPLSYIDKETGEIKIYEEIMDKVSGKYSVVSHYSRIFESENKFNEWLKDRKVILRDIYPLSDGEILCRFIEVN